MNIVDDKYLKQLKHTAKQVLRLEGIEKAPAGMQQELAQGVLDLIQRIKQDEVAINATLEQCEGHLSLTSLIIYYDSYKRGWKLLQSLAQDAENVLELPHLKFEDRARKLLHTLTEGK
jgi:hypothetical protein